MNSVIVTTVESFLKALKDTHIERKSTIPILQYAKVTPDRIVGTDLDLSTNVFYDGEGSGEFLIPYRQTLDALSGEKGKLVIEYTPGPVTYPKKKDENGFETDEDDTEKVPYEAAGFVSFTFGELVFRFNSMTLKNFPVQPEVSGTTVTIDRAEFATMLERTRFAISREESRYTLNGALFEIASGKARMVATDGHRLSLYESEHRAVDQVKALFPSSAIAWLDARAGKSDAIITIGTGDSESYITVTLGDRQLTARKLSGQFPNWEAIMPTKFQTFVNIPSPDKTAKTLARVAKCSDERSNAVRWAFDPVGGMIHAKSTERGEASAKLDCSVTFAPEEPKTNEETGETEEPVKELCIGLNANYIQEFLKLAKDTPAIMSLRDGNSFAMFSAGDNWKYVVMPMRM